VRHEPRAPREGINVSPQHPLSEAATLVAGLVGLLVLVGFAVAFGVDLAVRLIPPRFEARVFELAAPAEAQAPEPRREAVQALLRRAGPRRPCASRSACSTRRP
jgi:hypothetical protein